MLRALTRLRPVLPAPIWRVLRNAYWKRFWARELRDQQRQLGDGAAASLAGSERAVLAEAIGDAYPFESLLEVGCSYGQLFHVIGAQYRGLRLVGVDPDESRIASGRPYLEAARLGHVTLQPGAAEDLSAFEDRSFDIVVTSASLLYVPPDAIERALSELMRVAKKRIFLLEQHSDDSDRVLGRLGPARIGEQPYWIRNYRALWERFIAPERISIVRVPRPLWRTESWAQTACLVDVEITPSI